MFFGEYSVSVTEGGRIAIPKKIRENIKGDVFILTKGFDICVAGYERDDWQRRTGDLMNVSLLEKDNIDKRRMLFSGANEIVIDDQGRFVIPKALISYMGLVTDRVKVVGVGDHFEIWDEEKWLKYAKKINI
ncbi:division/cell wall cluster transcriptional repressor MraZ [Candidatus Roizmanbacteria bacterium RIFCSPLOWO2_02_FULL_37_19]|uniref:Transcriptional regulator MraZ n=1 Tax=Candidatus Roizmanbacteria bacterium RIFCSPHIGHO2_02_FULL_37_24 TaxID=1802037 RepID=A0A1F7GVP9_9BACT|nr:MAG: division/cell wall cluster transcriptional repressor MraZ [Candidatus Roizmanbacteria bacterium RIFCSPHIGHO2_02_FULL_37_24]OGK32692.1 MAG: division/cell wall cluster transcriptional repressor MraZ [Candidatus Roizmanbacteria bacterium RIFCSPHIGHO2_12_FULL_37_23]OGK54009.1 MAG: division/cell wall cluster transcriptional repressor MraZ [Candidatus Roizmanbacteria bacterium RIFCSPLOWO2_02_FULL_37_19]